MATGRIHESQRSIERRRRDATPDYKADTHTPLHRPGARRVARPGSQDELALPEPIPIRLDQLRTAVEPKHPLPLPQVLGRSAVEREFGRCKHEWALAPLRVRGLDRVRPGADLTILAKLACKLSRATRAVPRLT